MWGIVTPQETQMPAQVRDHGPRTQREGEQGRSSEASAEGGQRAELSCLPRLTGPTLI